MAVTSPRTAPNITLQTSAGRMVNLKAHKGLSVLFVYPYTGKPGVADPPGWDSIVGAHGSTPQALGYAALHAEFAARQTSIFGLSLQESAWQAEFAQRSNLPFELLSDASGAFSEAMGLEKFSAGEKEYLCRRTFILRDGQVIMDRRAIPNPHVDAANTLAWLIAA